MENTDFDNSLVFSTSRSFKEWLQDPSNPIAYCLLTLDGKEFLARNSYSVELHQKTADHDRFIITVPDDALDSFEGYVMEKSKSLLGKNVGIAYWRFGKIRQSFSGIITGIKNMKDEGGGYGNLIITGSSPGILLESGKDCQSFEDRTLEEIIMQIAEDYPQEVKIKVDLPNTKHALPYTVQYAESDYNFIRRLARRYGEFFYYNGEELIFGTSTQPLIDLAENVDLISVEFDLKIDAQDFSYTAYDIYTGSKMKKDSNSLKSEFKENIFQTIAVNTSGKIFQKKSKMFFSHTGIGENSEKELEEAILREKERRENLVLVKGKSRDPELKIGGRARLADINGKAMETYRIIDIKHIHEGGDDYYNEFVGIPDLFNAAPYIDTDAVPRSSEQPARVLDNNDPMGMGRIRVQFPWQEDKNQKTPWIRMIQPHSGSGKGFHFIPETGEEVLVGFEGGNAEKPFVMGTHYNGSEISSYHTPGNDKKVIHTRSGTKIILNDAEGSVFIEDPSGNTYLMDGQGNINVNAPNDMNFTAGKNLNINVGENMTTNIGMNQNNTVGMNIVEMAGLNIFQNATLDYSLNAANITKIASETYSYEANDIYKNAMENIDVAAGKDYIQNSEKMVHNLAGENVHNT
ncbi:MULTISPECIES: type VI secretion system Vgr family protein [unclassified Chryseobacterium]|uniref:type VI secretion system Vgr family protein n=1 Tax=unclassified Chryseobacterium TaxID=2593645 RepID=UPI0021E52CCC|nr:MULTISPECIES: type VI secretion system tip protein VgrG [unclassified Chryseobacterium]MEA1850766.1 type VI secretion system tip protein VgrG [Chryseobacterium sp. MHB01]